LVIYQKQKSINKKFKNPKKRVPRQGRPCVLLGFPFFCPIVEFVFGDVTRSF
jgi:hypothetical protein